MITVATMFDKNLLYMLSIHYKTHCTHEFYVCGILGQKYTSPAGSLPHLSFKTEEKQLKLFFPLPSVCTTGLLGRSARYSYNKAALQSSHRSELEKVVCTVCNRFFHIDYGYCADFDSLRGISVSVDGGPHSRVCARETLRSAPHRQ